VTHTLIHSPIPQRNSLNRREENRELREAQILTFGDDAQFRHTPVIECSQRGARVVLSQQVQKNDTIGVIVMCNGSRTRTFARVAWTQPLTTRKTVAGLEFLSLDEERAC
jgi:hypothetical protein